MGLQHFIDAQHPLPPRPAASDPRNEALMKLSPEAASAVAAIVAALSVVPGVRICDLRARHWL